MERTNNMTTQTRYNVFETNSSSTHSISIAASSDGVYETLPVDDNGVVHLRGGEFGWGWCKYRDAETKANYCAITVYDCDDKRSMLVDVIKEVTGATEVLFDLNASYIDHQSNHVAYKAFESKETLKEFIFNPKSVLRTGNDNDEMPDGWLDNDDGVKYDTTYLFSRAQITEHLVKVIAWAKQLNKERVLNKLSCDEQYLVEDIDRGIRDVIELLNRRA